MFLLALALCLALLFLYLYKLSTRLHGPHPCAEPQSPFTSEELSRVSYDNIDMLNTIPKQPTQAGYAIIGGSGFLGTYLARLLILRGETNIRIVDLHPPPSHIASHPSISYIRTDITSLKSVRDALTQPFSATGKPPSVIYHTAALIRFWERASYCWDTSYKVNVIGTENVLTVAKELPSVILVYTSTADVAIPSPKFMRLGWDYTTPPYNTITISDSDGPLPVSTRSQSCYTRSKRIAERLVIDANGQAGLKTGVIRPGYTIIGPNDRLVTSTLTMPSVPVGDKLWSSTNICVWDAAAAHLMHEDALRSIPGEAGGQAFLVSGDGPAWRLRDTRDAVKHYSKRPIILYDVSPLFLYILAHLVEAFLFLRYRCLLLFFLLLGAKTTPSLNPKWMGELIYLQPATLEYLSDTVIDDSRARKVLGYRPQWHTAQCIRYAVDEVQSGKAGEGHGLQLKFAQQD